MSAVSQAVPQPSPPWALPALVLGAACIGLSPVLVRLSEVGPVATAVNRVVLALPVFYVMAWLHRDGGRGGDDRRSYDRRRALWITALGGVFFGADLGIWHWSIKLTSVANATVLANLAPVFVALGAWLVFGQRVTRRFLIGLLVAVAGVAVLMGKSFTLSDTNLAGDGLGVVTSVFYGAYLLAISRARRTVSTAVTMALGGTVAAALLWVTAATFEGQVWPHTLHGWIVAVAMAGATQVLGQTLIAASFAYVPANFGAIVLLVQPIVAAVLAWLMFGEALGALQGLGAVAILAGVELARRATPAG